MLDFHRDRLLKAATHWNWQPAIDLLSGPQGLDHLNRVISEAVGPSQTNPLRLKILVRRDGTINCEKHNASAKPLVNLFPERLPHPGSAVTATDPKRTPEYEVLLDPAATARSEYTHYKTTKRDMYDSARERAKISHTDVKEVLVHLDNGEIMEGTITTPYFWRNDRWVTPPVAAEFHRNEGSGGQNGTTRRWALERYVQAITIMLFSYQIKLTYHHDQGDCG